MNTINESMGLVMPVFGSVHTDKELGLELLIVVMSVQDCTHIQWRHSSI